MNGKVLKNFADKYLKNNALEKNSVPWKFEVRKSNQGMMKLIALFTFAILLFIQSGCVPSAGEGGTRDTTNTTGDNNETGAGTGSGSNNSSGTGSGVGDSNVDLDNSDSTAFNWYDDTLISGDLTIDADPNTPVYLRGGFVDDFLRLGTNFSQKYCLVINYPTSSPSTQLRIAVTPIEFVSFGSGKRERLFRVNVTNKTDSTNLCGGTVNSITDAVATYSPEDLCTGTGCPGGILIPQDALPVTALELYYSDGNDVIDSDSVNSGFNKLDFDFSNKALKINTLNNTSSTGGSGQCTQASCIALGFDCCLPTEGQCANDGEVRPDAATNSLFGQATASVANDPLSYIDYPTIYFVCPSGTVGGGDNPADPSPTDNQTFAEIVADYECQEGTTASCDPDLATVTTRIQSKCCSGGTGDCSNYEYDVSRDGSGNITDVFCINTNTTPPPFSDQTVTVLSRSVPHRFFKTDGTAVDEIETLIGTSDEQEGDDFFYLDNSNKIGAQSEAFSMNSILGKMAVTLDQARPAKFINVEFDKTYIIGATRGSYIPCPLCIGDSWFNVFSAHPSTTSADGLQSVGFATRRDFYDGNTTNGNYEDTKFGRACYLPPTMIPWGHSSNTDLQTQRLNRLQTQAALFVNGYQKDWFGFNKGALIGSFDGVTWFAVGNGRRVSATSTKLYLAINGAFGDLASSTSFDVTIVEENGNGVTADNDFNPDLEITDPRNNQAASCQKNHQCETDSDCITQLGWEYMCADVTGMKSNWPNFDQDADERVNSATSRNIIDILVNPDLGDSIKRCVYRGRGAICQHEYDNLSNNKQKLATCAPNFYCAQIDSSEFNDRVARDPAGVFNILYGQEADVLGRPLNYINAANSLPAIVQANLEDNLQNAMGFAGTLGLCMPGKNMTATNYKDQMAQKDSGATGINATRTDYINQVGGCDSSYFGASNTLFNRVLGCPILDDDGDYIFTNNNFPLASADEFSFITHEDKYYTQNACGASHTDQTTGNIFAQVELQDLENQTSISLPSLAANACGRRAGSVCHSDLDCSPNRIHSDLAQQLGLASFGNTQAEKDYWTEFLVCGQAQDKPFFGSTLSATYDITQNKCCRPVGLDLSMAARVESLSDTGIADDITLPFTTSYPALAEQDGTTNTDRTYSRYLAVYDLIESGEAPEVFVDYTPSGFTDPNTANVAEFEVNSANDQWKTYHETGKKTCCGGGWIRKFADGTNDWSKTDRLNIGVENFACLNYKNDYFFNRFTQVNSSDYSNDLSRSCREAANSGCINVDFPRSNTFDIDFAPEKNTAANIAALTDSVAEPGTTVVVANYTSLNTSLAVEDAAVLGSDLTNLQIDNIGAFVPSGLRIIPDATYQLSSAPYLTPDKCSLDASGAALTLGTDFPLVYKIPAYINAFQDTGKNSLVSIRLRYSTAFPPNTMADYNNTTDFLFRRTSGLGAGGVVFNNEIGTTDFQIDIDYGNREIRISCADATSTDFSFAWPEIEFIPQGTPDYFDNSADATNALADGNLGMTPGSDTYYLTKLARMELLGIPQIHFEPLYCNSNAEELVPGIYTSFANRSEIDADDVTISDSRNNTAANITNLNPQGILDLPARGSSISGDFYTHGEDNEGKRVLQSENFSNGAVFSADEFMCCSPLGTIVADKAKCCSGHSRTNTEGNQECALPSKTNLNVYFNRFVSGEGQKTDDLPEGLENADFNPKTGEPKMQQSTYDKLNSLGQIFCDNSEDDKTRLGGAFGEYFPDSSLTVGGVIVPEGGSADDARRYGIVDSITDSGINSEKGYDDYEAGFKWNTHLYCR